MAGRPTLPTRPQLTPKEKFLESVQFISDNYQDRLSPNMIRQLDQPDLFFDIHAHCFTFRNVPRNFKKLQLIKVPHRFMGSRFYKWITQFFNEPDQGLLALFSIGAYYNSTLITKRLLNTYHQFFSNKQTNKHYVIVMLSMNMEHAISENIPENFDQQIDELVKTCQYFDTATHLKYSASIIPFLALDPNRENTYDIFLRAFAHQKHKFPFYGLKIYPTLGYLPSHPVLMDIFKAAEKKQIPITTHCGGASTSTDAYNVPINAYFLKPDGSTYLHSDESPGPKIQDYELFFNGPDRWRPVLVNYPKLRLNLAHFGSSKQWTAYFKTPNDPDNFVYQSLQLVKEYEHVYADISYSYFNKEILIYIRGLMLANPIYRKKFLFGSDYYMVLIEEDIEAIMNQFYQVFEVHPDLVRALTVDNPKQFLFP